MHFLYPIIFTLTVEQAKNLEFPAVSVCNFNRLGFSQQAKTALLLPERRNFFHCNEANDPERNETKQNMRLFLMEYYDMDEETCFLMGQNLSIFIEKCLFRCGLCHQNHSKYFQNSRYGNCITFNKGNKEMKILTVSDSGPSTGLILELNLQYDYYEKSTEAKLAQEL
ncbi:acid-sensing ion channel 1 [Trichonephila inaurata madagascariensis]|uniref:Acid-sensing ion channel 1 n=1 Tax=Trichonephila inaurata madagascariensis TaxID=2747483 RepID=A0A8X7BYF5_9ARAC|nr:acid-sensing ion channel 1 [Trichonephila inaurata madagascariensis]